MPRPSPTPNLGRMELRILQVLWQSGPATARQITDALNEGSDKPVAISTVQTMLRKMEAKNAVAHESEGRIFLFRSLRGEGEITNSATNDLLTRVFGGSAFALVAHLLRHEAIAPEERARLRALIDQAGESENKEV
jgi:BlaI family transcriptional regulator, penicillinase repressor